MNTLVVGKLLAGLVGGASMSMLGYLRKKQDFDFKKFVPGVVIAGIFGAIAGATDSDMSVIETMPYAAIISQSVQWLWKAILRRVE